MDTPGRVARRLVAHGRVQGVSFRAHVADAAARAGVAGSATNRADGSVEVVLEGAPDAVAEVERAVHEGPRLARVERVDGEEVDVTGAEGFAQG
jgi:acylphosphatase